MKLLTARVPHWRDFKDERYLFLDSTSKSGDPVFAPSRALLNEYKYQGLSQEAYVKRYTDEMRASYRDNLARWNEILHSDKIVVIACYCPAGAFCHRLLLKGFFEALCRHKNVVFDDLGEHPRVPKKESKK